MDRKSCTEPSIHNRVLTVACGGSEDPSQVLCKHCYQHLKLPKTIQIGSPSPNPLFVCKPMSTFIHACPECPAHLSHPLSGISNRPSPHTPPTDVHRSTTSRKSTIALTTEKENEKENASGKDIENKEQQEQIRQKSAPCAH